MKEDMTYVTSALIGRDPAQHDQKQKTKYGSLVYPLAHKALWGSWPLSGQSGLSWLELLNHIHIEHVST